MRVMMTSILALMLAGCAAGPERDDAAACAAQGHQPDTEAWRACMEGGGAEIATGPGSPYANVDEEEDSGGDEDDEI